MRKNRWVLNGILMRFLKQHSEGEGGETLVVGDFNLFVVWIGL